MTVRPHDQKIPADIHSHVQEEEHDAATAEGLKHQHHSYVTSPEVRVGLRPPLSLRVACGTVKRTKHTRYPPYVQYVLRFLEMDMSMPTKDICCQVKRGMQV